MHSLIYLHKLFFAVISHTYVVWRSRLLSKVEASDQNDNLVLIKWKIWNLLRYKKYSSPCIGLEFREVFPVHASLILIVFRNLRKPFNFSFSGTEISNVRRRQKNVPLWPSIDIFSCRLIVLQLGHFVICCCYLHRFLRHPSVREIDWQNLL